MTPSHPSVVNAAAAPSGSSSRNANPPSSGTMEVDELSNQRQERFAQTEPAGIRRLPFTREVLERMSDDELRALEESVDSDMRQMDARAKKRKKELEEMRSKVEKTRQVHHRLTLLTKLHQPAIDRYEKHIANLKPKTSQEKHQRALQRTPEYCQGVWEDVQFNARAMSRRALADLRSSVDSRFRFQPGNPEYEKVQQETQQEIKQLEAELAQLQKEKQKAIEEQKQNEERLEQEIKDLPKLKESLEKNTAAMEAQQIEIKRCESEVGELQHRIELWQAATKGYPHCRSVDEVPKELEQDPDYIKLREEKKEKMKCLSGLTVEGLEKRRLEWEMVIEAERKAHVEYAQQLQREKDERVYRLAGTVQRRTCPAASVSMKPTSSAVALPTQPAIRAAVSKQVASVTCPFAAPIPSVSAVRQPSPRQIQPHTVPTDRYPQSQAVGAVNSNWQMQYPPMPRVPPPWQQQRAMPPIRAAFSGQQQQQQSLTQPQRYDPSASMHPQPAYHQLSQMHHQPPSGMQFISGTAEPQNSQSFGWNQQGHTSAFFRASAAR